MTRLRFGIFMAPFHPAGENPTHALERDLELIEHLDRLGYDEVWVGEHHSAGSEIIASPEIFIGVAAQRTPIYQARHRCDQLLYHNPLWVAERIVMLDHLTRAASCSAWGLGAPDRRADDRPRPDGDPAAPGGGHGRDHAAPAHGRAGQRRTSTWNLQDARLHLRPYSDPLFDVAVAAVASPSGPRLAGKHGVGLLSVGATQSEGFDVLGLHWDVMEERGRTFGMDVDRDKWRLVGLMHIADTKEQAYREVEYGIVQWFNYFQHVAAFPQMAVGDGRLVREMIDFVNGSGLGTIGTVDEAAEQIDRLPSSPAGSVPTSSWRTSGPTRRPPSTHTS